MANPSKGDARFRKDALRTMQETPISAPLSVVSPKAWYFLAACLLVSLTTLIWAFTYRVPNYVSADGICLVPESVRGIAASTNGRIASFDAKSGQQVRTGDLIATINVDKIAADIQKSKNLLSATQDANKRFQAVLDQWINSALVGIDDQKEINAARLVKLNISVSETQSLVNKKMEQSLAANDRLQALFGAPTAQSRKILRSMQKAQKKTLANNRQPDFSNQTLAEHSRTFAEDERSLLNLQQQRMEIEEDQLNGQNRVSELINQIHELESTNRDLSLQVLERKRTYESEMMARHLDEVKLSLELNALEEQKQREETILSSHSGTVLKFHKTSGDNVLAGERIGTLILHRESTEKIQCLAYFSIGAGNRISTGDTALTTPSTHRRERHGSIRGSVIGVEQFLATEDSLFVQIGNRTMSQRLLNQENLKGVRIALEVNNNYQEQGSESQYNWTGSAPADFVTLKPGTTADVRIRIDSRTPVELAFTNLRRWLGPSGK